MATQRRVCYKNAFVLLRAGIEGASLGSNCYKVRLAIRSKAKGKSGGARVITHLHIVQTTVILLTIYDKAEKEDLTPNELDELLAGLD